MENKNVLFVLPTGFGKSLVFQLMASFSDFMDSGFRPTETGCITSKCPYKGPGTKVRDFGLKADLVALYGSLI